MESDNHLPAKHPASNEDSGARDFEEPLTAAEAGTYLRLHAKTVLALAREGKLPSHKVPGTARRLFFKSELHKTLTQAS